MCLWCPFPSALRAEGERSTGQKVSFAPCLAGAALTSGARHCQHRGTQEQACGAGGSVGLSSSPGTRTSCLLLTCISTTMQAIYRVPWAMCSSVAKLLPVQLGTAQQNAFCWGPQFPSRTLKRSLSVFYKSCGPLSSSFNAPTRDPRQLLACPSSASLFLRLSGPHVVFKHL